MGGTRPLSQQEQQEFEDADLHVHPNQEIPQSVSAPPATRSRDDGSRSSTDSPSVGSTGSGEILHSNGNTLGIGRFTLSKRAIPKVPRDQTQRFDESLQGRTLQLLCVCVSDCYGHQVCQAETPHEVLWSDLGSEGQVNGDCKVVVSGLLCGKPVKWEVLFDIRPYLSGREREEKVHEELWNETFHYLAGRSIIQDFEHMAEKECEMEHGEAAVGNGRLDSELG